MRRLFRRTHLALLAGLAAPLLLTLVRVRRGVV
jgi:hypothetical protein